MQPKQVFFLDVTKSQPLRPSSRNSFLPDIQQTPNMASRKVVNSNNVSLSSRGMETLMQHKNLATQQDIVTARFETRKEIISEIFRKDKKPTIKPIIKQPESNTGRPSYLVRFEDNLNEERQNNNLMPKSILKRKSSNSKEHSDILDFFEMPEDPRGPGSFNRLKNSKQVTLQPIQQSQGYQSFLHQIEPNESGLSPKKVKFNKQIQIKVIDHKEETEQPKSRHRNIRRQYTVADLMENH